LRPSRRIEQRDLNPQPWGRCRCLACPLRGPKARRPLGPAKRRASRVAGHGGRTAIRMLAASEAGVPEMGRPCAGGVGPGAGVWRGARGGGRRKAAYIGVAEGTDSFPRLGSASARRGLECQCARTHRGTTAWQAAPGCVRQTRVTRCTGEQALTAFGISGGNRHSDPRDVPWTNVRQTDSC